MAAEGDVNLLEVLADAISNLDTDAIYTLFENVPFDEFKQKEFELLFAKCLKVANDLGQDDMFKLIFEIFQQNNIIESQLPLISDVFNYHDIDDDTLDAIKTLFPKTTLNDHLSNFIDWKDDDSVLYALERLFATYQGLDLRDSISAYNYAYSKGNKTLTRLLATKVSKINEIAEKPEWIIENPDPSTTEPPKARPFVSTFELPDEEAALDIIRNSLSELDLSVELEAELDEELSKLSLNKPKWQTNPQLVLKRKIDTKLRVAYRNLSDTEKKELLLPYLESDYIKELAKDPLLFQWLGPCNPSAQMKININDPEAAYGGHRMFLCTHFEVDDDDNELQDDFVDWFSGNCDYCLRKIERRVYAIRRPLITGGFQGCYCSVDCIRSWYKDFSEEDQASNILNDKILNAMEIQLLEIGIIDRIIPKHTLEQQRTPEVELLYGEYYE